MSPDLSALSSTVLAWHHADWMWAWGGLMIVVWAAIIGTLVWMAALPADRGRTPPSSAEHARKVLAERLACGEIDAQEYYDRLEALDRGAPGRRGDDRVHA